MRMLLIIAISLLTAGSVVWAAKPDPTTVARQIDRLIAQEVDLAARDLAPRVGDSVFLRRVHLDLIGAIPTPQEVRAFLADTNPNKRERLVAELVERSGYGLNQARYWRDVIFSRRLEDRSLGAAPAMVEDLAGWINAGEPWDAIARRFITAEGKASENGATAIFTAQDGRTEEIAGEVSRVFLGVQLQCAQCHDHPWDDWKREQFHELAAFFPRIGVRPIRNVKPPDLEVRVNDRPDKPRHRRANNLNRRGRPEHYMQDLERPDEDGARIAPRFFLTSLELPAGTRDARRREALAEELTGTDWFATALVNRYWSELVGEGFYEPVDDLGPEREATAPRAVQHLAAAFRDSGYDLRWLHRTILASEAYQRESRPRRSPDDKPFAATIAQPLRGDQLFNALLASIDVQEGRLRNLAPATGGGPKRTPRRMFNLAFGFDPSVSRSTIQETIPQVLARMNSPQINQAITAKRGSVIRRLSNTHKGNARTITTELYLRTLSREPTEQEIAIAQDHLKQTRAPIQAAEDLLWVLLNSAEFSHRR